MGEDGAEIYIDGYGRLIPVLAPTIFKDIPSGGKVFNEEQMKNLSSLWNLSNFKMPDYSNLMKKAQNSVVNNDNSYHVHFQNLELDNSIIDIDKLKRYVGTH